MSYIYTLKNKFIFMTLLINIFPAFKYAKSKQGVLFDLDLFGLYFLINVFFTAGNYLTTMYKRRYQRDREALRNSMSIPVNIASKMFSSDHISSNFMSMDY